MDCDRMRPKGKRFIHHDDGVNRSRTINSCRMPLHAFALAKPFAGLAVAWCLPAV